jgi:uncharacterized protein DUF1206
LISPRRVLFRIGYAALGAVYVMLGIAAISIATQGGRDRVRGFASAFRLLLSHPRGPAIVAAIAGGLVAFTLARLLDAGDGKRSFFARALSFIDALGHAALAWLAVRLLLRVRRGLDSRSAVAWLLSQPWGPRALQIAGLVVIAIGVLQFAQGATGRLPQKLTRRYLGAATDVAVRVGRFGVAVRGIVTAIIGWFLVRTARDVDPRAYHDIGGALEVLERMRFGALLLGAAGAGLIAYGAYLVLLGFFRRKA